MLELVKEKDVYPYEYMKSFKRFFDDRLPDISVFYISLKDEWVCEKGFIYMLLMSGICLTLRQWVIIMIFI